MNFKYFRTDRLIPFIIILSIVFQFITNYIEELLRNHEKLKEIASYIDVLSTLGLIGAVLAFLNEFGWKWKWRIIKLLIDLPDLNGRYKGTLKSSFKDEQGNNIQKDCVIEIKQSASNICICAYYSDTGTHNETSQSHSVSEQLVKEPNGLFSLYYIFTNDASTLETELNNHHGTAHLKYFPDIKILEGEYYNKRGNTGTIKVQLEDKNLLGRYKP